MIKQPIRSNMSNSNKKLKRYNMDKNYKDKLNKEIKSNIRILTKINKISFKIMTKIEKTSIVQSLTNSFNKKNIKKKNKFKKRNKLWRTILF